MLNNLLFCRHSIRPSNDVYEVLRESTAQRVGPVPPDNIKFLSGLTLREMCKVRSTTEQVHSVYLTIKLRKYHHHFIVESTSINLLLRRHLEYQTPNSYNLSFHMGCRILLCRRSPLLTHASDIQVYLICLEFLVYFRSVYN